jgi:hypothetical protein
MNDEQTSISAQMLQECGPVVLINMFTVEPEDAEQFLKQWAAIERS